MKYIFIVVISLSSWSAYSSEWYKEASSLCNGMPSTSRELECQKIISSAKYMNVEAVKMCKGMPSISRTIECLPLIKDKKFRPGDVKRCNDMPSIDRVIECVKITRQAAPLNSNKYSEIKKYKHKRVHSGFKKFKSDLKDVLVDLELGKTTRAKFKLKKLINKID